jgi:hypothetical protein
MVVLVLQIQGTSKMVECCALGIVMNLAGMSKHVWPLNPCSGLRTRRLFLYHYLTHHRRQRGDSGVMVMYFSLCGAQSNDINNDEPNLCVENSLVRSNLMHRQTVQLDVVSDDATNDGGACSSDSRNEYDD